MTNEWFGRFHDDDWESWNAYPEALKATGHKALKYWKVAGMSIILDYNIFSSRYIYSSFS